MGPFEWGWDIRKILRSRLPERLKGRAPSLLVELGVAAVCTAVFFGLRLMLVPMVGERAPYAFVFLAIVIFMPEGVVPGVARLWRRIRTK